MTSVSGLRFDTISGGMPVRRIVLACNVRLLLIWLYVIQYSGYHREMVRALKPRRTSSTQASSKVIQEERAEGRKRDCLASSQKDVAWRFWIGWIGLYDHRPRVA